ncbi:peptide ABC transporter substrate-binding protein [Paramicrobacterium chengjingii]|uniref:ABC transporter substrate-binding protein n=1 Tax=Paramicrobacterium chengjingii TaxID=2769067 RepID=A0ABX6YNA4_9MICO|nr:ABC transporter substrate-binding protein [Microbacterium chengjingii]QPZ40212.1 ABC transporter substrate-binding protein [Microbacterium chengjingii]
MRRLLTATAVASVAALALAGCSNGGSEGGGSSDDAAIITVNSTEPQKPLIPTNTNEVGGGKILDSIFAGLIYYDVDGAVHNEVAKSIKSDDSVVWDIQLNEGWKFTNGEEVTAKSFVDAWNYGALLSNEQLSSYFFEDIEGFSWDEDSELTGLEIVDDYHFTVTLSHPASDFGQRLGYSAFYPLPSVAFEDMKAFGENPVGNGVYKLAGDDAWEHDVKIDLVKNEDYKGDREAQNGGVTMKFYANMDAAYADLLSDQLDVLDEIPASSFGTYESDLGERTVNQPSALFESFTIGQFLDHFKGDEGKLRRQALSMSINRDEITDVIFEGTRTPASDFTSPIIDGWSDELDGAEVLEFNEEKAKDLWAQADEISPWEGTFKIAYNSDDNHQAWVDAVCNSIANVLDIKAEGDPYPTFAEMRTKITNREITTAHRSGWQADYPGLYNFLGPLYGTGAGSNDGDYSSEEFDSLIKEGISSTDAKVANEKFQEAQEVLLQDLPAIPLWYENVVAGYSTLVDNVEFGWNSVPLYYQITKTA